VPISVRQQALSKVDVLFVVDNSPGMGPKQTSLRQQFPDFIKAIDSLGRTMPLDYHIGVVTSDLGAGQENLNRGQCHPDGDNGRLQPLGAGAFAVDPTCVAPSGNYIAYNQMVKDAGGLPMSNLPGDHSLNDLGKTFGCMATVGSSGCGFEHQLESAYRALGGTVAENAGFLRPDAFLMVVFVTDEDDCSAPPTTDLFSQTATQYGPDISYRCTQYGVQCGGMALASGDAGPLSGCAPLDQANGGKLFDVSRYIDFFTKPASQGGLKADPSMVYVTSISAPETPFSTLLANISATAPTTPYQSCATSSATCTTVLQHSCTRPSDSTITGDPAVRLRAVVAATGGTNGNACDDSYSASLGALASVLTGPGGCFPSAPTSPPSCTVADVSTMDGSSTPLPQCVGDTTPCWQVITSSCASGYSLNINRGGAAPPANSTVSANCLLAGM
jgi:hypothetical protein